SRTNESLISRLFPRPPRASRTPETGDAKSKQQRVYVLRDGQPLAVSVVTGSTDGVMTEITGGDIALGSAVITDMITASP
ncbi:MAG TPA: efflux RND transporter periplasmic adaptor subunit, partial [Candidatus Binatia bacterium]|nr:efflux RND transporter periplasmic adaptor subunit [Candidatus Binatia bacterium]